AWGSPADAYDVRLWHYDGAYRFDRACMSFDGETGYPKDMWELCIGQKETFQRWGLCECGLLSVTFRGAPCCGSDELQSNAIYFGDVHPVIAAAVEVLGRCVFWKPNAHRSGNGRKP